MILLKLDILDLCIQIRGIVTWYTYIYRKGGHLDMVCIICKMRYTLTEYVSMRDIFTDTVEMRDMTQYVFRYILYKRWDIMMQYVSIENERSLDSIYRKEGILTVFRKGGKC